MRNSDSSCFPVLKTERCHLINLDAQYTKDVFTLFRKEKVTKYIDGIKTFSNISEAEDIINVFQYAFLQGNAFLWGIKLLNNKEDTTIGVIGVFELKTEKPQIFYALEPEKWNKGIMTECVIQVTDFCLTQIGIIRLETTVGTNNKASQSVLTKAGYQKDSCDSIIVVSTNLFYKNGYALN